MATLLAIKGCPVRFILPEVVMKAITEGHLYLLEGSYKKLTAYPKKK
jgi:hypothetical protein